MLKKEILASNNLCGIGLRSFHIDEILKDAKKNTKKIGWLEIHSENYYAEGGPSIKTLIEIRKDFPISLHSVGNSLGSSDKIDLNHLKKLKELIKIIDPFLVSDHISWGAIDKKHLNDLLPLPYTKQAFIALAANISRMQDFLDREILIENPSTYLTFKNQEMSEFDFINQITKKTGCKLLLDVNNIYVSAFNNKAFDAKNYLQNIDKKIVKEIHLAGHSISEIYDGKKKQKILIDTHNDFVCDEVWELYKIAIARFKKIPTLIEWDQDFPALNKLLDEAKKAQKIIEKFS